MTAALGILQLLICMLIVVHEYNRRSIALFFWGMVCVVFALPHAIDTFVGGYSFSDRTMETASLFVVLFSLVYLITRQVRLKNPKRVDSSAGALEVRASDSSGIRSQEYVSVFVAVFLAVWIALFSKNNFGGVGNASWGAIYSAQSGLATPVFALAPYLFASIAGAVIVLWGKKRRALLLVLLLSCLAFLLITRNRVVMLSMVCPLCILVASRVKKLSIKHAMLGLLLVFLVVYIVYAILVFRHAGTAGSFFSSYDFASFNGEVLSSILSGEGELGLRNIFYFFIENGNHFEGFSQGATYIRMLLFWLPSGIGDAVKPDDFAITMASAYMGNPSNETYSVHPTFFGDAFANFGFLGFLIGIFWGALFNVFDVWMSKLDLRIKAYIVSAWSYALVLIGRGSVYNGLMIWIVATIIIFCISASLSFFAKRRTDSTRDSQGKRYEAN